FQAAVILGFLAHLTFLHAYLALGVWTVYHFARHRGTKGNELRQLLRVHAVPAGFFVLLSLKDVRGMESGGGARIPVDVVAGRLLCFALGAPFSFAAAGVAAIIALGIFVRGCQILRRGGAA